MNRRSFLIQSSFAFMASACSSKQPGKPSLFEISLAEWTINRELKSGVVDHLEFAKIAHDNGIHAIEYVNQFFMDKASDNEYLSEMKRRAEDLGVRSLLIMCDREGRIGDPDKKARDQTVENHRKWIDAARYLGCHSIRVNAASEGSFEEQVKLASDGLSHLAKFGAEQGIYVLVENHGGLSSNADWLSKVMETVDDPFCGTLPDFGNFKIKDGVSYDSYRGVDKLMPWARGVSVKDKVWDDNGNQSPLDFERMLGIVLKHGYHGYCGIEYGGYDGLTRSRQRLETARRALEEIA